MKIEELIADPEQWPACPRCHSRNLLIGGLLASCPRCDFLYPSSQVEKTTLYQFSRVKMVSRMFGARGVLAMIDDQAWNYFDNRVSILDEKSSELGRFLTFMPSFENTKKLMGQHQIPALGVAHQNFETPADISELSDDRDRLRFREQSLARDAVAVLWAGDPSKPFWDNQSEKNPGALLMNVHVYNAPSSCLMARFNRLADGAPVFEPVEAVSVNIPSLVWQPIYWPIIECCPKRLQPRYVAALESENDININFSVVDDLDRGPIARIAFRKPWQSDLAEVREYPVSSTRSGIALIKQKFVTAKSTMSRLSLEYEAEWKLGIHSLEILNQIRTAAFWGQYAEQRERH